MSHLWLLPEQLEDLLPAEAWPLEHARRTLIDLFRGEGYELVAPPALEYLESLLTGSGQSSDLVTFKVVDQLSGRLLGLRADITPQVARIDAHRLDRNGVSRLCYAGSVYHAVAPGPGQSRESFQIGAELYGHPGLAADLEVQSLLITALAALGLREYVLDIGHVGIFRSLTEGMAEGRVIDLLGAMQGKNIPRIDELTAALPAAHRAALRALPLLCGGADVLQEARRVLPANAGITAALDELALAAARLQDRVRLEIDLAELRGYSYHSGMVFAAYARGYPGSIARGGRYDDVGLAYGRARAATGFSIDLGDLLTAMPAPVSAPVAWLAADVEAALSPSQRVDALAALRDEGVIVLRELRDPDAPAQTAGSIDPRCDSVLEVNQGVLQRRPLAGLQHSHSNREAAAS